MDNSINLPLTIDIKPAVESLKSFLAIVASVGKQAQQMFQGTTLKPNFSGIDTELTNLDSKLKQYAAEATKAASATQQLGEKAEQSTPAVTNLFGSAATQIIAVNQGIQLLRQIFQMFSEPVKAAAELDTLRESFQGTATDIENFRKATAGTVTEANLIKLSNQARDLGLTMQQQVILFGLAEDAADKYGGSVEDGFQRIVAASEGMSRGLKTIGVQRAVFDEIVKKLAADQGGTLMSLDAEAQKRIRLQAIIQASGKTWEEEINKTASSKDQLEQIDVVMKEASESIGQLLLPAVKSVASAFKGLVESFTKLPDAFKIMFAGIGTMVALFITLNSTFGAIPYLIAGIVTAFISLVNAIKDGNVFVAVLSGGLAGLAIAFIAVQLQSTLAAASILTNLIPAIIGFFTALGPIGWAIVGVSALGAGLIALYSAYGNTTENQLKNLEATNKAIDSKIKEKESIRSLSGDYETLNQKLVAGNLSQTERDATEKQLHDTLVKIQAVYPSLISNTNDYSGSLDGVKKAAQLAGDEIDRLNKLQTQNQISQQRVQLDKGFGDIQSMLTDTYVADQTDVVKKINDAITGVQKGQLSASSEVIKNLAQEFSDLSIKGGTYAAQNLKISEALEKQKTLIDQHKQAYSNLNGSGSTSSTDTTDDPVVETIEAKRKELQKKIEQYKLEADKLPVTQKEELAKYRNLIADTQAQLNDLSITGSSSSSSSGGASSSKKSKDIFGFLNQKDEADQLLSSLSTLFSQQKEYEKLTGDNSSANYQLMLNDLNGMRSKITTQKQLLEYLTLEKGMKQEINKIPDSMKDVKVPNFVPFVDQLDDAQKKLNDLGNTFGLSFTVKFNSAIQSMTGGLLNLADVTGAVKDGFNAAARGLASAGSQAVTIFRQANSVLQAFINTLIQTIAQELILKAVMLAFKFIGLSGGGDVAQMAGYASGGPIHGPGTETSDSIPAMLSKGEYVVNAHATRQHKPLLDAINYGSIRHFATGGYAGAMYQPALQPIAINLAPDVKLGLNDLSIALKRTSVNYGKYR